MHHVVFEQGSATWHGLHISKFGQHPSGGRYDAPKLVLCIDDCMLSIINIINGIKEPTCGYHNCNTSQMLIFGGYVKVRDSLIT
jgi:hypothetical protein